MTQRFIHAPCSRSTASSGNTLTVARSPSTRRAASRGKQAGAREERQSRDYQEPATVASRRRCDRSKKRRPDQDACESEELRPAGDDGDPAFRREPCNLRQEHAIPAYRGRAVQHAHGEDRDGRPAGRKQGHSERAKRHDQAERGQDHSRLENMVGDGAPENPAQRAGELRRGKCEAGGDERIRELDLEVGHEIGGEAYLGGRIHTRNQSQLENRPACPDLRDGRCEATEDRKSTRLNSSHSQISYAVFCLKKKKTGELRQRWRSYTI